MNNEISNFLSNLEFAKAEKRKSYPKCYMPPEVNLVTKGTERLVPISFPNRKIMGHLPDLINYLITFLLSDLSSVSIECIMLCCVASV